MASQTQVKKCLALWFQLGHAVVTDDHSNRQLCPQPVFYQDRYTPEFEQAWSEVIEDAAAWYLEGAPMAIADLLSSTWDIIPCSNCLMPIPASIFGEGAKPCLCQDLAFWPNSDLPMPRLPANGQSHLCNLCERLSGTTSAATA